MRALLIVGLLFVWSQGFAFSYTPTNVYGVREGAVVWAEFKDEKGEYPLQCRLENGSKIRMRRNEGGFIYATLLVSTFDLPNSLATIRGACRLPQHTHLRIPTKRATEIEGRDLTFLKE